VRASSYALLLAAVNFSAVFFDQQNRHGESWVQAYPEASVPRLR
jgi:hypothetical protein